MADLSSVSPLFERIGWSSFIVFKRFTRFILSSSLSKSNVLFIRLKHPFYPFHSFIFFIEIERFIHPFYPFHSSIFFIEIRFIHPFKTSVLNVLFIFFVNPKTPEYLHLRYKCYNVCIIAHLYTVHISTTYLCKKRDEFFYGAEMSLL